MTKILTFIVTLLLSSYSYYSYCQEQSTPTIPSKEYIPTTHFKYNAVTFGSIVGSSLTNSAKSILVYNQNQLELSKKFYFTSYVEYYRDQENVFISNYINGLAFVNYKLPKKINVGMGYRYFNSFQSNIQQNFIQLKFEKVFTWN